MFNATLISRYRGIQDRRFMEDFCYQLIVMKKVLQDKTVRFIPISFDINYEMAFNRLDETEDKLAKQANFHSKVTSDYLFLAIDRGITNEMEMIVRKAASHNPNMKLILYTIQPFGTLARKVVNSINEEQDITEVERLDIAKAIAAKFETKNRLIYDNAGDLTNYRVDFSKEIIDAEQSALVTFGAALEKKIQRDMVNAKDRMASNPFELLNDIRKKSKSVIENSH